MMRADGAARRATWRLLSSAFWLIWACMGRGMVSSFVFGISSFVFGVSGFHYLLSAAIHFPLSIMRE
ncbi:MAG: hypothetical protein A3G82_05885 [Burkholderiales bacterium RIFCSPLOWO2_12_FULL_67_210]|nr:MAG: hypothetical protein A3G82_05885 [Burkholderiales bacterium RIFCSPLOWO2_12_FULL_67_210]